MPGRAFQADLIGNLPLTNVGPPNGACDWSYGLGVHSLSTHMGYDKIPRLTTITAASHLIRINVHAIGCPPTKPPHLARTSPRANYRAGIDHPAAKQH